MTNNRVQSVSDTREAIELLVIDGDSIFRLGLCNALAAYRDFQVVAVADNSNAAFDFLSEQPCDLIILDLLLRDSVLSGLELCQRLKSEYPNLPIVLLTAAGMDLLLQAQASGVEGYCPKGLPLEDLVEILRQVYAGNSNWEALTNFPGSKLTLPYTSFPTASGKWMSRLSRSGLSQIDKNLTEINKILEDPQLSVLDALFWRGRKRELLAARWLVDRLLPVEVIVVSSDRFQSNSHDSEKLNSLLLSSSASVPVNSRPPLFTQRDLFERTMVKIQAGVDNGTKMPMEIDILQPDKKKELLYLVLNQVKRILDELRYLQIALEELPERRLSILRDLWQTSTIEFLSKYYSSLLESNDYRLADILLEDGKIVQKEILASIPFVLELLEYLVFERPLLIDNVSYRHESPEAIARSGIFLENLITQIANGVMSIVLNNFAEVEYIKQSLYQKTIISSRKVASFRNYLFWKYLREKYWEEPKSIFESQYRLFYFIENQIKIAEIYSPRQEELEGLTGLRWGSTIALEARDAISPLLNSLVDFGGRGLVYLLKIIGKGIGLIAQGIVQGVSSALQQNKNKNIN